MYDKCKPKTRLNLILGFKVRIIEGIRGQLSTAQKFFPIFTDEQYQTIERICQDAKAEARREYEANMRKEDTSHPETNQRIASESRQYAGK